MTPRRTYLLFAVLALVFIAAGGAAVRFWPSSGGPRVSSAAPRLPKIAGTAGAPQPSPAASSSRSSVPRAGGFLQGLRGRVEPEQQAKAEPPPEAVAAPAPEAAMETPPPQAEETLEASIGPAPEADVPMPPARPPGLIAAPERTAPLPPVRPSDLAALPPPAAEEPAPPPTPPPPVMPPPAPAPAQAAQELAEPPGPVYADVPVPPTRPRSLAALAPPPEAAPAPVEPAAQAPAAPASAPGPQQAAHAAPEPALRPAPESAFPPPEERAPARFGMGDPVFVRIFKQEGQLELWLKRDGRYHLYKTYPVCKWSGHLGPKIREADYQSPEGFYSVSAKQLHPHSNYHRAFNVGYPNAFDKQNGRTGGLVMVHGNCKSVGCFAMTDPGIEEIYGFVEAALRAGQREAPVHIFPFRMTDSAIARETSGGWLAFVGGSGGSAQWGGFWRNLKEGYDLFEQTGAPPAAYACGDHYAFGAAGASCKRIAGW